MIKRFGKQPNELIPTLLSQLHIQLQEYNYKYQVLPNQGYTTLIQRMLSHPRIKLLLNTEFSNIDSTQYDTIFYTGTIDSYIHHLPKLEYRSIQTVQAIQSTSNQPYPVILYPLFNTEYIQTVNYTSFPNQSNTEGCLIVHEKMTDNGEPCFPVPTLKNQDLYQQYKEYAKTIPSVRFVGQLATYSILSLDEAIRQAILNVHEFMAS
jgi:UDP-galactopyranose mutase